MPHNNQIRILCLHEEGSNAIQLKRELRKLGERLYREHDIDLIYVNAPLTDDIRGGVNNVDQKDRYGEDDVNRKGQYEVDNDNASLYGSRKWWDRNSFVSLGPMTAQSLYEDDENDEHNDDDFWETVQSEETSNAARIQSTKDNTDAADSKNKDFVGLDASILLLRQIWRSSSCIGILGIGQGAAMGALLNFILQQESVANGKVLLPPQFAVFINAHSSLLPAADDNSCVDESEWSQDWCRPQFLHIFSGHELPSSEEDYIVHQTNNDQGVRSTTRKEDALLLHRQVGGEWFQHEPIPSNQHPHVNDSQVRQQWTPTTVDLNRIGRFLVFQKNRLGKLNIKENRASSTIDDLNDQGSAALVAIQQALHRTEEEASALIAKEITAKPPKALMAVIQPSLVAGRQSDSKQNPPGGGAPCPSDFRLHRDDRTASARRTDGPSRVHPSKSVKSPTNNV